ncbi:hypothetical protein SO694_00009475 [Aureococcus anophagefferens]|uniref:ABC1 atypical kinase-like domain-containing protein n=1 Tax=Aureococcus anophagefferens TaxID=44056 RepID=A0ABR1GEP9_AURAN
MAAAATMPPAGQSLTEQVTDTLLYPFHSAALLARRLQVYGAAYYIFNTYCSYEEQAEHLYGEALEKHWADAHTRLASVAVWHATSLLGLWVKLAQFMSSRTDVLPEPWIAALAQLQDSVPPRPYREVATTLAEELGADFADLFESVSAEPLAAASIAQVHRATLRGGADVVLKVQHRGVRQVVLQDLENATYLCEYVAAQKPEHDFRELLREWIDETKRELDFEREALNTDLVGDALRSAGCACTVPGVIRSGRVRPTARLLPLEFVDGVKPNDARALSRLEVDVDELLGDISEAFATNILIDGRFNADPHPGNILVRKSDGRPVLLDFGLTKVLPEPSRLGIARLVLAAAESDAAGVVAAVRALSLDKLAGRGGEGLDARHALDVAQFLFRDASVGGRRGGRAQRAAFDDRRRQRSGGRSVEAARRRARAGAAAAAGAVLRLRLPARGAAGASPRAQASEIDGGVDDADREDTESDDGDAGAAATRRSTRSASSATSPRLAPRKDGAGDALRAFERLALTCVPEDVVDAAGAALGEGGVVPDPRLINEPACASVLLPSTTMHATAAGLAAVYGALAHGGAVESGRGPILDPYQVDDLHRDFEAARDAAGDGPASPLGFSRYGLERAGATRHAFGHAGLGQMFAFADPEDGLGVAVLVNQISPEPVAADAALACLLAELGAGRRIM